MTLPDAQQLKRWAVRSAYTVVVVAFALSTTLVLLWRDRPSLDDIDWAPYPENESGAGAVNATWLGASTLLFDDGETQILIDGFVSRPSLADVVLRRPIDSNAATVNYVLDVWRIRRLAAVIPVHSHYDHAMDVGAIANRTSASILGSETTANIARGASVPEDQIVVVEDRGEYTFGQFNVTMIESPHAPIGWGGSVPYAGSVDEPLQTPAPASAWREGQSYSIVISHPHGTTIVQGSAGFSARALQGIQADVVMLGVSLMEIMGRKHAEDYWQAVVTTTGAAHVIPIHFDDFTQPFGEIVMLPGFIQNMVEVAAWLEAFRDSWDQDAKLHLPEFGKPMVLYPRQQVIE